jgi:hypothetical protein
VHRLSTACVAAQAEDDALKAGTITLAELEPQALLPERTKVPVAAMERRGMSTPAKEEHAQPGLKRARAG